LTPSCSTTSGTTTYKGFSAPTGFGRTQGGEAVADKSASLDSAGMASGAFCPRPGDRGVRRRDGAVQFRRPSHLYVRKGHPVSRGQAGDRRRRDESASGAVGLRYDTRQQRPCCSRAITSLRSGTCWGYELCCVVVGCKSAEEVRLASRVARGYRALNESEHASCSRSAGNWPRVGAHYPEG